jgi:acid phosphatase family membrane protein YuiD
MVEEIRILKFTLIRAPILVMLAPNAPVFPQPPPSGAYGVLHGPFPVQMITPGIIALISGLAAQIAKVVIELVAHKRFKPLVFFDNGGMPSSHTSTVTTLSLTVGRAEGFDSSIFSLVLIFSLYVIFEATGLRQEVGKQARVLNEILDELIDTHHFAKEKTRELLGHTWSEVFGGFVLGLVLTLLMVRD